MLAELQDTGKVRIKVKGTSMLPLLRSEKDEVLLRAVGQDRPLRKGSIFLFRHKDGFVLHRLVNISGDTLTFRGDNVFGGVETCTKEDVAAEVIRIFRLKKNGQYTSLSPDSVFIMPLIRAYRILKRLSLGLHRLRAAIVQR